MRLLPLATLLTACAAPPISPATSASAVVPPTPASASAPEGVVLPPCVMSPEVLATSTGDGYRLEAIGSRSLCLLPKAQVTNLWPHAAKLRITNTGSQPLSIEHFYGDALARAFKATVWDEAHENDLERNTCYGPEDPREIKTRRLELAPGQAHEIGGNPQYVLALTRLVEAGEDAHGVKLPRAARATRTFPVDFRVWFKILRGGKLVDVTSELPTKVTITAPVED